MDREILEAIESLKAITRLTAHAARRNGREPPKRQTGLQPGRKFDRSQRWGE